MKVARLVVAALLLLVGGVWFGQGVGWIGGSFMTGSAVWAVIGAACVIGGLVLARSALRPRRV